MFVLELVICLILLQFLFRRVFDYGNCAHYASKDEKDNSSNWVAQETLKSVSAFAHKGDLDYAFTDVNPSTEWKVFPPDGEKRICIEYDGCITPFHEYLFSLMGFHLPFNDFKISVMNHLMIDHS